MGLIPNYRNCFLSNQIAKELEHLASNTAAIEGFEIVKLSLLDQMNPITIHIKISRKDKEEVSLNDCAFFSSQINETIEASQLIKKHYVLEISSPGLNDILETDKEFETFKGFPIEVSTKNNSDCSILQKSGLLHTRSKEHLLINVKGKMSKIPRENVIEVRLASPTG